jgi:hypothetical protein
MKRVWVGAIACVLVLFGVVAAWAQSTDCPACALLMGYDARSGTWSAEQLAAANQQLLKMMREAGVSEQVIRIHSVAQNAPIYLDSPGALLAQSDALKLDNDQRGALIALQNENRAKARALLTEAQKAKLGPVPEDSMSACETLASIHRMLMPLMQKMAREGRSPVLTPANAAPK